MLLTINELRNIKAFGNNKYSKFGVLVKKLKDGNKKVSSLIKLLTFILTLFILTLIVN
jgi:hypothetical protein